MVELADIFLRYEPDYIDRFGSKMLPSHHQAMNDIICCRTEQMGGHLYCCENPDCEHIVYAYHSCGNRSCPKCGQDKTQRWIQKQHNLLLKTHYFLVTFTLPCELRSIARSNQNVLYYLLFKSSAAALQKLAKDPGFVGGDIGMMGGLHTWQRDMGNHLHVHFIVPGKGLSPDRSKWLPSPTDFFVPVEALSPIFRAKFRDALKKTDLFDSVPAGVWEKDWVVHCKPVGISAQIAVQSCSGSNRCQIIQLFDQALVHSRLPQRCYALCGLKSPVAKINVQIGHRLLCQRASFK